MNRWTLLFIACFSSLLSHAQWTAADSTSFSFLPTQDQAKIKSMQSKLGFTEEQNLKTLRLFVHYFQLIDEQKKIMDRIAEEQNIDENARVENLNSRSAFIKQLREERDLNLELILTPEQIDIYNSQIKIAKPQVLHFGVHDRMNCPVCVSPNTAP
mgnify:CR=1 FL=1